MTERLRIALIIVVIVVIVAATVLLLGDKEVPDALWAMGTLSLGGIIGISAPAPEK